MALTQCRCTAWMASRRHADHVALYCGMEADAAEASILAAVNDASSNANEDSDELRNMDRILTAPVSTSARPDAPIYIVAELGQEQAMGVGDEAVHAVFYRCVCDRWLARRFQDVHQKWLCPYFL